MRESFTKNKIGILLMIASSFFACIGQLFWKLSVDYGLFILLIGFIFYFIGALLMLVAYKFGSLSVLQPILSFNYIISIIMAAVFLKEPLTLAKVAGVIIIMFGVVLIGGGDD
jgi:undecaprenyl phosphate-alpha-L-ara4N flippase subunit ArnE